MSVLNWLCDLSGFPARWQCGDWSDSLGWVHIVSDTAIFAAYIAIPAVLAFFIVRRPDVPFPRVAWLFVAFIVSCGLTHIIEAITFWYPLYRLSSVVKAVTATVSWATVGALAIVIPRALTLRSPAELEAEVANQTARLAESEQRFRFTFEQAAVGIGHVAPGGRWVRVNSRLCDILGYSRDELLDLTRSKVTHPKDQGKDLEFVDKMLSGELDSYTIEKRYLRKDGSTIWVDLTVSLVRDDASKPQYFISVIDDISQRKQVEEILRSRTKDLELANHDLESFAYSVSHDLRAPLRAIDGYGQMLMEDHGSALDAEADRIVTVIRKNTHKMSRLCDDLLEFSRLGRKGVQFDRVDMQQLAEDALQDASSVEPERKFKLEMGTLPTVDGDRVLLRQVWANLASNAVKYTKTREEAHIRVGADRTRERIRFWIRDNGIGFDPKHSERLFEVFQRLHRDDEYPGTGVGLALVARIVRRHGGEVGADANLDGGAEIWFDLPVPEPDASLSTFNQ